MKIDDMTLTLFARDDIPAPRYGQHTGRFPVQRAQPLDPEDGSRQEFDSSIMATEYSPGVREPYQFWILQQATDYLCGDVAVKGGITTLFKTAHLAEALRMNLEIHHGGNFAGGISNALRRATTGGAASGDTVAG